MGPILWGVVGGEDMSIKIIVTQCIEGVDTLKKVLTSYDGTKIDKEIAQAKTAGAGYMVKVDTGIDYHYFLHTDLPYEVNGELVSQQKGVLPYDEFGDYFGYEPDDDYEYQNFLAHPDEYVG